MGVILLAATIIAVSFSQWMMARAHDQGTLHRRDARGLLLGRTKYLNDDVAWEIGNRVARPLQSWIMGIGVAGLILAAAAAFFWPAVAFWMLVGTAVLQVALLLLNTVRMVRASGGMQD